MTGRHYARGVRPLSVSHRPLPGLSAMAAIALLAAGIPAAHAQLGHGLSGTEATQAVPDAADQTVQAAAGAAIDFPRTTVTTIPAPAGGAAGQVGAAASPAGTTSGSPGLSAPLAAMSVSSPFGLRISPITGGSGEFHTGLDLQAACQTAVFAAGAGAVVEAGWSPYGGGNRIVVEHANGLKSTYNHLSSIETTVGATVSKGQRLAGAGTTGNSTGCHLHFEVVRNGLTVDPQGWIQP